MTTHIISRGVLLRFGLFALALVATPSCAPETTQGEPPATSAAVDEKPPAPPASAQGLTGPTQTLRLHGSNTIGLSLAPALAKAFLTQLGATNIMVNGDDRKSERIWIQGVLNGGWTSVEVYAPGSKVGFTALASGGCDIALASRPVKPEEAAALRSLGDMNSLASDHVIGIDGIAVIVNKNNRTSKLTTKQLGLIFDGELTNWSQFGGASLPIHLYSRDAKSGTHDAFTSIVMGNKTILADAKTFDDSEALSASVAADEGGIGYVGLPFVKDAKSVAVQDGDSTPLFPTVFTVGTEDYALSRRLHFYAAEAPRNPLVRQFVDFALSDAGQRIVEQTGFVSLALRTDTPPLPEGAPAAYGTDVKGAVRLSVNFRFRTGSSQLDAKAAPDADRVLKFLALPENRSKHVILHGFADKQGAEAANLELSRTRGEAVAKELRSRGISPDKIAGWGSALPIAPNDTPEGRERNRRVELWIR